MKRGFTLIELLAVIIILAIVALIATPIILDVVEDARMSAAESEANMIVSGINNYCATSEMKKQMGTFDEGTDVDCTTATFDTATIGKMVNLGNASISGSATFSGGQVTAITVVSNGYNVVMTGGTWADPTE